MTGAFALVIRIAVTGASAFFACGQSLGFRGFDKSELASPVKVALSAMTILTKMQQDGYALLP